MKRHLDRLRRAYDRNRHDVEQITACVLGLTIGITLGALSLGSVERQAAVHAQATPSSVTHHAPR